MNYSVYKHTCPSGKVYIGITMQKPEIRWNKGLGYKKQDYFYKAILKYGWDNIKHEVLYKGLSKAEAENMEIKLIKEYNKLTDEQINKIVKLKYKGWSNLSKKLL